MGSEPNLGLGFWGGSIYLPTKSGQDSMIRQPHRKGDAFLGLGSFEF